MALQELIQINSRLKMEFWNLIHIESRLKQPSGILNQIDSSLKNYLEYWFELTHDSMILFIPSLFLTSYDLFGHSTLLLTFFGISTQVLTSYDFFLALDSSAFPRNWFESAHDSCGFPRHWFRSTHDSKCLPIFNSNLLITQVKNIWFRVDSLFDSESYPLGHPGFGKSSAIIRVASFSHFLAQMKTECTFSWICISWYLGSAQNRRKIHFCAISGYLVTLLCTKGTCHVGTFSESSRKVTVI